MTEWWQQDENDQPASIPRRDEIPGAHFSAPVPDEVDLTAVSLIPEWRARRRVVALVTTICGLGLTVFGVVKILQRTSSTSPWDRGISMIVYTIFALLIAMIAVIVVKTWRWAEKKDSRGLSLEGS